MASVVRNWSATLSTQQQCKHRSVLRHAAEFRRLSRIIRAMLSLANVGSAAGLEGSRSMAPDKPEKDIEQQDGHNRDWSRENTNEVQWGRHSRGFAPGIVVHQLMCLGSPHACLDQLRIGLQVQ